MNALAGCSRLLQTLGVAASAVAALLFAKAFAPAMGTSLALPWAPHAASVTAAWGRGFRLGQFMTYLCVLAILAAFLLVWTFLQRTVSARSKPAAAALSAVLAVLVLAATFFTSPLLGAMALGTLVTTAILLTSAVHPPLRDIAAPSQSATTFAVLLCEVAAASFAVWVVLAPHGFGFAIPAAVACAGLAAALLLQRRFGASLLSQWVLAGAPALLLPLLGLFRAPSVLWILGAAVAGWVVARRAKHGWTAVTANGLLVPALCSLGTICIIPVGMRELASVNYASHEAQHLGWVNSALHGRLLGADAGTFYGILREYLIVAFCWLTGTTVEHVRIAHVLLNLGGMVVLLAVARKLIPGRPLLLCFVAYLVLFYTPLRAFCDIDLYIAFGWADALRCGAAVGAVVTTAIVLTQGNEGGFWGRRTARLVGCGVWTAFSLLYSQEFGLCAAASVLLAAVVSELLASSQRSLVDRLREAARSVAAIASGMIAVTGAVLCGYAVFGKARLLVETTYRTLFMVGSCVFGCLDYPVNARLFEHPDQLLRGFVVGMPSPLQHDALIEYIVPVAVYGLVGAHLILAWLMRRWDARCTVFFALLALGVSSYRMTLARATIEQVMNAAAPAILCLGMLVDASLNFRVYLGRRCLRLGRLNALVLALVAGVATERIGGLGHQVVVLATGKKAPSGATPYQYPDIPRAGDVYLDRDFQAVTRFVQSVTSRQDPIFTMLYMMDGGELYFLADRKNPTRYDLLAEVMTAGQQREVLDALRERPPKLIIGSDATLLGREVQAYVRSRWSVSKLIGRYTVWMEPAAARSPH